jgi:hypothetical protein
LGDWRLIEDFGMGIGDLFGDYPGIGDLRALVLV